jgi:hypothetical protein
MPAQLTKTGLQSDWNVKQIAIANRMFYLTGIAEGSNMAGQFDDYFP